jgi:hypothetical protein
MTIMLNPEINEATFLHRRVKFQIQLQGRGRLVPVCSVQECGRFRGRAVPAPIWTRFVELGATLTHFPHR